MILVDSAHVDGSRFTILKDIQTGEEYLAYDHGLVKLGTTPKQP